MVEVVVTGSAVVVGWVVVTGACVVVDGVGRSVVCSTVEACVSAVVVTPVVAIVQRISKDQSNTNQREGRITLEGLYRCTKSKYAKAKKVYCDCCCRGQRNVG